MEIQFYGANCVRLTTKKASIIIDDNLASLGLKSVAKAGDVVLCTTAMETKEDAKLVLDQPGEYEVSDVSIQGIAARAHMDEAGKKSATIFKIIGEDIRVAVVGHILPELGGDQLESLGTIDVLIVPVGNSGLTLDIVGAMELVKKIEPKLVIPTHYADKDIKYPVPQQELEEVIKGFAMEPREAAAKLKLKPGDLGDLTELAILERQ